MIIGPNIKFPDFKEILKDATELLKVAAGVVKVVAGVISKGFDLISKTAGAIRDVLVGKEVIKPEDKMEELGDKVIQAGDTIKPSDFESYDQYIDAIRNFELDPEVSEQIKPEDKLGAAVTLGLKGLEAKLDMPEGSAENIVRIVSFNPDYFDGSRLEALLDKKIDFDDIVRYFSGDTTMAESKQIRGDLLGVSRTVDPDKSDEQRLETIQELRMESNEKGL